MATHPPQYVTLTPDVTSLISFPVDLGGVEILNIDGSDEVWIRFGGSGDVIPMSPGTYVLPATIGYLNTDPETSGPTKVYLCSPGAVRVGVRGTR